MGAYAPAPVATADVMAKIVKESLQPTIDGMRKDGAYSAVLQTTNLSLKPSILGFPFVGMLFTGFMLTQSGPKVLEYNVRFGDPETEALMLLLSDDTDLAEILIVRSIPLCLLKQKSDKRIGLCRAPPGQRENHLKARCRSISGSSITRLSRQLPKRKNYHCWRRPG